MDQLDGTEFRINDQSDYWDFGGSVFVTERWRLVTSERTFGNENVFMKVSHQWQSEDGVLIYSSDWIAWLGNLFGWTIPGAGGQVCLCQVK